MITRFIKPLMSCLLIFSMQSYGQTNPLEDLFGTIKKTYEERSQGGKCQNDSSNPFYIAKNIENNSLDALVPLTDEQEMEIGEEIFNRIAKKNKINNNHPKYEQVNAIFQKLVPHVSRKGIKYQLHIIESETINAFATVGGNVYVNTAILDFVDSEDELAFILGHEIAHIDEQHTLRRIKKILFANSIGESFGVKEFSEIAVNISMNISAPFDQMDEFGADDVGYDFAKKAGYDMSKFEDFFKKLEKSEKKTVLDQFLSTHPFPSERRKCLHQKSKE